MILRFDFRAAKGWSGSVKDPDRWAAKQQAVTALRMSSTVETEMFGTFTESKHSLVVARKPNFNNDDAVKVSNV